MVRGSRLSAQRPWQNKVLVTRRYSPSGVGSWQSGGGVSKGQCQRGRMWCICLHSLDINSVDNLGLNKSRIKSRTTYDMYSSVVLGEIFVFGNFLAGSQRCQRQQEVQKLNFSQFWYFWDGSFTVHLADFYFNSPVNFCSPCIRNWWKLNWKLDRNWLPWAAIFPLHKSIIFFTTRKNQKWLSSYRRPFINCEDEWTKFSREMSIFKKEIEHEELLMDVVHQQLRKMIR